MPRPGPYGDAQWCWADPTALSKEEAMHPAFMESVAAERVKDMRSEAIAAKRARTARRTSVVPLALRLGMPGNYGAGQPLAALCFGGVGQPRAARHRRIESPE